MRSALLWCVCVGHFRLCGRCAALPDSEGSDSLASCVDTCRRCPRVLKARSEQCGIKFCGHCTFIAAVSPFRVRPEAMWWCPRCRSSATTVPTDTHPSTSASSSSQSHVDTVTASAALSARGAANPSTSLQATDWPGGRDTVCFNCLRPLLSVCRICERHYCRFCTGLSSICPDCFSSLPPEDPHLVQAQQTDEDEKLNSGPGPGSSAGGKQEGDSSPTNAPQSQDNFASQLLNAAHDAWLHRILAKFSGGAPCQQQPGNPAPDSKIG